MEAFHSRSPEGVTHLLLTLSAAAAVLLQNGAERGWVLKGVDEINLLLEDMGLNLQSMMASPHVRPFAEEVRNWEQRLSLIGEAIEVCCWHCHSLQPYAG